MQIVIDIPEEIYELIINDKSELKGLAKAVKNGIPLEQIRDEIEAIDVTMGIKDYPFIPKAKVLDIIDKYTKGE